MSRLSTFMHANSRTPTNKSQRRRNANNRGQSSVDRYLLENELETGGLSCVYPEDIARRPINGMISQRPPRNLDNQIFWWKSARQQTLTLNYLAPPNEFNMAFSLDVCSGYAALTAVFDQFCLYSVIVSFSLGANSNAYVFKVHTAVDLDNIGNLGTLAQLEAYSSHHESLLNPTGLSHIRYVKPNTAPVITTATVGPAGVSRNWLDCGYPGVVHYGLRSMFEISGTVNTAVDIHFTYIIGFRNAI